MFRKWKWIIKGVLSQNDILILMAFFLLIFILLLSQFSSPSVLVSPVLAPCSASTQYDQATFTEGLPLGSIRVFQIKPIDVIVLALLRYEKKASGDQCKFCRVFCGHPITLNIFSLTISAPKKIIKLLPGRKHRTRTAGHFCNKTL